MSFTITFGECAENHVGMQKIGKKADEGYSYQELKNLKIKDSELIKLHKLLPKELRKNNKACVLIIRNGTNLFLQKNEDLLKEHSTLEFDKKAKMRGRVVNKRARWNLCYGDKPQKPDYENGKGTVIDFKSVPLLNRIRNELPKFFGNKAKKLKAELNVYYDIEKCFIGFHGDTERKIVIAIRLGKSIPLFYQWYYKTNSVFERKELTLNHGDMYIMSEKATGFDWRKRNIYTLRHAAGRKFKN